ncbi:MAG: LCP family protein [bacterium]|nr:LCP family protein [bacterium]
MEQNNSNTPRRIFLLVIIIGFIFGVYFVGKLIEHNGINNPSQLISSFLFPRKTNVKSNKGRVNVLILGRAGSGYSAPDLTDTIIAASISNDKDSVRLFSIPRDIWVPSIRAKINSAYYWGNQENSYWGQQNNTEDGNELVKSLVSEIVGQPIHYVVVVDFSGFKEIVDVLGGIDIDIKKSFVDTKYPIAGKEDDKCGGDKKYLCRFETVGFQEGPVHMDGETALKFVRSRNAEGEEGTDLAREARQQKVISGIERKVLSGTTIFNSVKLLNLWRVVQKYIKTDMDGPAVMVLTRNILSARKNVSSFVFPEGLLVTPPKDQRYDFQYVFIPKGESWDEIHMWVNSLLQ